MWTRHRLLTAAITVISLGAVVRSCPSLKSPKLELARSAAYPRYAPDFALRDGDGKIARLSDYRGHVVMLDFWATWCGPCKAQIPQFMEVEHRNRAQGLMVIGVSLDEEGWPAVTPVLAELHVDYRVLLGDAQIEQLFGSAHLPTTVLIDREGRIAAVHVGIVNLKDLEVEIKELLGRS